MRHIVWVTAPSGAGKTEVLKRLADHFSGYDILSDAEEMLKLNKQDVQHEHHVHPNGGEEFLLTSTRHFDGAVRNLSDILRERSDEELIFVELARGKGDMAHIDPSYNRLLQLLPEDIFDRSVFVYVETSHRERMMRNAPRRVENFNDNIKDESFRVPVDAMNGFYKYDDFTEVKDKIPCPVFVIENGDISLQELDERIMETARKIKAIVT